MSYDVFEQFSINGYSVEIQIDDHGDRLDDYEPFWKWNLKVVDLNKNVVFEKRGPAGGYYDSKTTCVEEIVMEMSQMNFFNTEDDSWEERIREKIV